MTVAPFVRRLLGAAAFAVAAVVSAAAQELQPQRWSFPDAQTIHEVQNYLDELPTVRARFLQTNHDGSLERGLLWLWRPGLVRIEYSPPTELLLVADGTWLVYFDADFDQVSHIPIGVGPFRFLLAENVDLFEDVLVSGVERRNGHVLVNGVGRQQETLRLTIRDKEAPDEGWVTMVFTERPLALRNWEVVDPQGFLTVVQLYDEVRGERFDRDWFYFPERARKPDFRIGDHTPPER